MRKAAESNEVLYVITGPVLKDPIGRIGLNGRITVPKSYYKVIATLRMDVLAFIVPNCKGSSKIRDFIVTVDDVEEQTGLDFFSKMPLQWQDEKESRVDLDAFPPLD